MLQFVYMGIGTWGMYICLFFGLYFEVFLLLSFLEKRPNKKTSLLPRRYPRVSVIVPCYNESLTLEATVKSLLSMEYPQDKLEVLVVDDGSTDTTRQIGERLASTYPEVKYFYKENGGKYTALNFAITQTDAEFVGCLDADSFVEKDALTEVMKRFEEDESTVAIVPVMKVHNPKNFLELMQAVEYTFGIFVKKIHDNLGSISVLPGPFSIYRREVFSTVGPFRRAHQTEDMEMAYRIQHAGLKIVNAHTAFVHTTVPRTVKTLIRQRTRWTQGFLQNSRDYWFMFFNPKFGNFGLFALPFSIILFFTTIYMTGFLVYGVISSATTSLVTIMTTGILPEFKMPSLDWFYADTSVVTFLVIAVMGITLSFLFIGKRIAQERFGVGSVITYLALYGFLAPLWLLRALWGTILARESSWR